MKQLVGIFQIPEEVKYQLEVVLSDFNKDRPGRYRLSFSCLYRALVNHFLEDLEFRSNLLGVIGQTQIPIPVLTCPFCNSTEGFRMFSSPYKVMCNRCTRPFDVPKDLREYQASMKLLHMATSKISGVTDFEKVEEIKCVQCGAFEVDQEIPVDISDNDLLNKKAVVTCKKCGFVRNEFGKLTSRDRLKGDLLKARQRLRCFDPEELRVNEK